MSGNFEIAVITLLVIGLVFFAWVAGAILRALKPAKQNTINAMLETQRNAFATMRGMH